MEPAKIHLREVTPIGTETHQHLCSGRPIELSKYPDSPTARLVRDLRVTLGLGLRDAARLLGLEAVELSALERGSKELVDERLGFQEVCRRFLAHASTPRKSISL